MSENSYLSGKLSTRNINRRQRFNPMGSFSRQYASNSNHATSITDACSHSGSPASTLVNPEVPNRWWLQRLHSNPNLSIEKDTSSIYHNESFSTVFEVNPSFLNNSRSAVTDTKVECTTSWKPEFQEPTSTEICSQSTKDSVTNSLIASETAIVPRYLHHIDPDMVQVNTSSTSRQIQLKSTRQRKRKVQLCPKFPKYQGLSRFAAPMNVISGILPVVPSKENDLNVDLMLLSKSSNLSQSNSTNSIYLTKDKIQREEEEEEEEEETETKTKTKKKKSNLKNNQLLVKKQNSNFLISNEISIDFLKNLKNEEWFDRQKKIEKLIKERQEYFLKFGFGDPSGKPFPKNDLSIDKKPIPNRWVWYIRLSLEYEKMHGIKVPPGGPAGYLKYGWDRMGKEGKQPYQELADVYSAQKAKHLAKLGIGSLHFKMETNQQKLDQPLNIACASEPGSSHLSEDSPRTKLEDLKTPSWVIGLSSFDSNQQNSITDRPSLRTSITTTPDDVFPNTVLSSDGFLTDSSTDTHDFLPTYLHSAGFDSDFISSLNQQGLVSSADQTILNRCAVDTSLDRPLTENGDSNSTDRVLIDQSTWKQFDINHTGNFQSTMAKTINMNDIKDHQMIDSYHSIFETSILGNSIYPSLNNEKNGVIPTFSNKQFNLLGFDIDDLF
ncbi:hypothetical protein CROQUDRAFT_86865 [Cronartium quercuum f. sp. fusiforme G11]|uniref:Uncharacterized protein n=1 Tax=Cronartium quercuum f. sp. fusiforme G11 TaxID=708437 RepID=A0A9P6NT10_9BASI|nr:hypothetical protein CROQUDRAFT_86865 [Cronartium quercuum f. sp. fusiforme G11]